MPLLTLTGFVSSHYRKHVIDSESHCVGKTTDTGAVDIRWYAKDNCRKQQLFFL